MSIGQIADLAYVLQIEQLEHKFHSVETAFWINRSDEKQEPPDFGKIVEKFNESLEAEFEPQKERTKLHRFYGLR